MATSVIDRKGPDAAPPAREDNAPVTLHRTMQMMIGEGLRARYRPPQKLSHELFVVLLQLKEAERRSRAEERSRRGRR
jgi:hypothetical protein